MTATDATATTDVTAADTAGRPAPQLERTTPTEDFAAPTLELAA